MLFVRIELSKNLGQIISNRPTVRYWQLRFRMLTGLFLICLCGAASAQVRLSEQDLTETISFYKKLNQSNEAKIFQAKMPKPIVDEKTRRAILENLPPIVLKLKIENSELSANLKKLFNPVLKLYARESVYEIIVFKHPTPIMFSDSGVVIVVSTGIIKRAASDDELLGYLAHEVGHEYYAQYSIYSRHLLKLVAENGRETALSRKYLEAMALIELQCDGFAALTLSSLQYNSISFIEGFEKTAKDFPAHSYGNHPPDEQRRKLVEQIAPKSNLSIKPLTSAELIALKELIGKLEK
jgi:Zn-dependent protease with chaperone function